MATGLGHGVDQVCRRGRTAPSAPGGCALSAGDHWMHASPCPRAGSLAQCWAPRPLFLQVRCTPTYRHAWRSCRPVQTAAAGPPAPPCPTLRPQPRRGARTRAQLLAELLQLLQVEVLDVHREVDGVQQRRGRPRLLPVGQLVLRDGVPVVGVLVPGARRRLARRARVGPRRLAQRLARCRRPGAQQRRRRARAPQACMAGRGGAGRGRRSVGDWRISCDARPRHLAGSRHPAPGLHPSSGLQHCSAHPTRA